MCKNVENLSYRIFENMHTHLYEFCIFFSNNYNPFKTEKGEGKKNTKNEEC